MKSSHQGQSLTEILIALAIGVAFINVGILAMSTANILAKVNKANNFALSLLKSQRSILETISENGWHSIADLTIGKHYKLAKQNNTWIIQQGEEKVFNEKPPVAQWNFDEGTGSLTYDNVGTNDGTLVSSPTWQTSSNCVSGTCLSFNGSSNYVNIENNNSLNITGAISISAWIKPNEWNWQTIFSKGGDSNTTGYYFGQYSYDRLYLSLGINGNNNVWESPKGAATVGAWYNAVAVYNGTSAQIYVNGVPLATTHSVGSDTGSISISSADALMGYVNSIRYLNGSIDDVRIYAYALTENQIQQHYNAGLNRLGLISQWGMDEGSGTMAYDSQGTNDGTLTNGPTWQTSSNCVNGNCLSFDGTNDYIDVPYNTSLNPSSSFALEAWVKFDSFNGTDWGPTIISKYGGNYKGYMLFLTTIGYPKITILTPSTSYTATSTMPISLNQWTHLAGVWDGSFLYLYINGVFNSKSSAPAMTNDTSVPFTIGKESWSSNGYIDATLDDVRIYNRALSVDEIANQYKDGYTKYFYVNNVSRDIASDPTASTHNLETTYNTNHDDPNTKKITNVARYLLGTPGRVNTQEQYLARASNINSLIQTDWSGNSGVTGPEIDFGNNYFSSSNLTLSTTGQMSLTSAASNGNLISSIIDTQSINGSGYFNILWQGDTLCSGCSVKFQIATSNSNTGPWTYYGPTSTSDYYTPSGPNIPVPITYAGQYSALSSSVQNKRYIRYQITLVPASSTSPVVKDVIINYAQ